MKNKVKFFLEMVTIRDYIYVRDNISKHFYTVKNIFINNYLIMQLNNSKGIFIHIPSRKLK